MHDQDTPQTLWRSIRLYVCSAGLLVSAFVLFFWNDMVVTIHSGELGVKYSRFFEGTDLTKTYSEGVHFIWPFDILYVYDMRIIEYSRKVVALTKTGLPVTISVSCQYQLDPKLLPLFHQQVGPTYRDKIILPMMDTVVRQSIGTYDFDSLYSSVRQELEDVMMVKAVASIGRLPITIHNFIIKNIELPRDVEASIVDRMVAKQRYKRYEYLLLEAGEEAKRKHIEALGIRDFQNLVNTGMTENYLRYEGIVATRDLAASNNAKIVVTGGKDGLPLILNPQESLPQPEPQAQNVLPRHVDKPGSAPARQSESTAPSREDTGFTDLMDQINAILSSPITPPLTKERSN